MSPGRAPSATPVTDIAKRRIEDGESIERIIKISNTTAGRLHTLQKAASDMTEKEKFYEAYRLGEEEYITGNLDRSRELLKNAGDARDAAIKVRDKSLENLDDALARLNVQSQVMSDLQDGIALTLAAIPIAAGLVVSAPVALVIGVGAVVADQVNDQLRADGEDNVAKTAADGFGDTVGIAGEVVGGAGKLGGALTGVGLISTGFDVYASEGITARLEGPTHDAFQALGDQIEGAGPIDKTAARQAASEARVAQRDLNSKELKVKAAEAYYLSSLAAAEGVTWVKPR